MPITPKKNYIKSIPMFEGLQDHEIEQVIEKVVLRTLNKGDHLAVQGELCKSVYLIAHGLSRIYTLGTSGEEATIELRGQGDAVGAIAAISGQPFVASAQTIQKTDVLIFSSEDFQELTRTCPNLPTNLMRYFAFKTKKLMTASAQMQLLDLEERVWRYLLNLVHYFPNGVIPLSHEEIARITGSTRPRISEILSTFKTRGLIQTARRKILLESDLHFRVANTN